MIKFFRKIRQRLLTENKFSKYLLYAIGEIALVMIGILLALQVNNWNENRKKEIFEIQYLGSLIEDLEIDTLYYTHRSERSQNVIDKNRQIIRLMYQIQETVEDVEELYANIKWDSEELTIQNATYIELTNSGNLNIFKNQNLKNSIIFYYREMERTARNIKEFDEVSTRHLIHLAQIHPNRTKFHAPFKNSFADLPVYENDWAFMNDPSSEKFQFFTFTLAIYKLKHERYLNHFKTLKNMSTQLITDIQLELESRN